MAPPALLASAALVLLSLTVLAAADCPTGKWQPYQDQCYVLLTRVYRNAAGASQACQQLQPGATLPSIHSAEQNQAVLDVATTLEFGDIWLGLSRVNSSAFQWQDGTQIDFVAWEGDEPNNTGDCVYMDFWKQQWRDINCDTAHFFVVCQYTPE